MVATWLALSLLYPFLFSVSNLIDKFLLEKSIRNCFSLLIIVSLTTLALGLGIMMFAPLSALTTPQWALGVIVGLIYSINIAIYFYSMSFEEASRVISVLYLTPVFVSLGARFFLGESLSSWKYGAIIVSTMGAILIGMKEFKRVPVMRKGFLLLLGTCFLGAIGAMIQKHLLASLSFWNVYTLSSFGVFFGLSFVWFSHHARKHLRQALRSIRYVLLTECLGFSGAIVSLAAVARADVSLVSAMGSVQPLYLLIMMLAISTWMPHLLKEVFTKKAALIKVISVLMIVIGTFFVAL